jgi:alkanesulfonate monooxygenase SsuD/methylene tetrahydromethanopterin reductase-like flavin-dependent oxidoreductase (luciferase family)
MRIAAVLSPVAEWPPIVEAARAADEVGLDAVGFYDHYHSAKPEWAYICGWSAYGALAALTERVHLAPMVINSLHYELGVLAKESSVLAIASGNRFELALGAGDWPASFAAWGTEFPPAQARLDRLEEMVGALRLLWTGEPVTTKGRHIALDGAICTPVPERPPPVIVGVGGSRRTLVRAAAFADELNLYDDPTLVAEASRIVADSPRPVALSVFLSWEWGKWPADDEAQLECFAVAGVDRAFVTVASQDMPATVRRLGTMAQGVR